MLVGAVLWFVLNLVFSWITVPLPARSAGADRFRAKLLHGADGGDPAAHRRSRLSAAG
jgi:hypothetical protein